MKQIFEKKIAVGLATAIFLLIGCEAGRGDEIENNFFTENPYVLIDSIWAGFDAHLEEGAFAVGLAITDHFGYGLYNPTFDPDNLHLYEPFYGNVALEQADDVLAAVVENISLEANEFIFKVFLNYEEVSFRILGMEDYVTDFVFTLEARQQVEFPFILGIDFPEEDVTYKLTATIFLEPYSHASSGDNDLWFGSSNAVSVDVSFGNGGEINLAQTYNHIPLEYQKNWGWSRGIDIWLAPELYNINSALYIDYANLPVIQVSPNETLNFGYLVGLLGPHNQFHTIGDMEILPPELVVQNYVVLALLDWQQIPLNGHPYLFVTVEGNDDEDMVHYGQFSIIAPGEPGLYDFIAFIFPNANYRKTLYSFLPISASFRFTIEVVE